MVSFSQNSPLTVERLRRRPLLISASPTCGKTALAAGLIKSGLKVLDVDTIIYGFFPADYVKRYIRDDYGRTSVANLLTMALTLVPDWDVATTFSFPHDDFPLGDVEWAKFVRPYNDAAEMWARRHAEQGKPWNPEEHNFSWPVSGRGIRVLPRTAFLSHFFAVEAVTNPLDAEEIVFHCTKGLLQRCNRANWMTKTERRELSSTTHSPIQNGHG